MILKKNLFFSYTFGVTVYCLFLFQTFFPSGYFIPLTQCTHHSNNAGLPNRENAGLCSLQHTATQSLPTAGEYWMKYAHRCQVWRIVSQIRPTRAVKSQCKVSSFNFQSLQRFFFSVLGAIPMMTSEQKAHSSFSHILEPHAVTNFCSCCTCTEQLQSQF